MTKEEQIKFIEDRIPFLIAHQVMQYHRDRPWLMTCATLSLAYSIFALVFALWEFFK